MKGDMIVVIYEFLLRVRSEGCAMFVGCDSDALELPQEVPGSVWICWRKRAAYMRLRQRKNRAGGSLMMRSCVCGTKSPCGFCSIARLTADRVPGSMLWRLSPLEMLKLIKRYLILLHTPNIAGCSLKMFRAGKACALAADGKSMKVILELGEWRSIAVLKYLNAEAIDEIGLLKATLDASDEEGTS